MHSKKLTIHPSDTSDRGRGPLLAAVLLYALFVAYGSFVPLDFHPRPLDVAWQTFCGIPYLQLEIVDRADWVANIVLYIPFSFFLIAYLAQARESAATRVLKFVIVFLGCLMFATAVEFTQLFFPPRTVSFNDIIAELTGSALGICIWQLWGNRLAGLWRATLAGGKPAIRALFGLYVIGYLTLSLFPYDFLLSVSELQWKVDSQNFDWWLVRSACASTLHCGLKLLAEVVAVVPLGALYALNSVPARPRAVTLAVKFGLVLGLAIEVMQFFIASGMSQGLSVLTRAAGMAIGALAYRSVRTADLRALSRHFRWFVLVALVPYLAMLMAANGWFAGRWLSMEAALARLQEVRFIPFYYHYFTSEAKALSSLLVVSAMFLPVGLGCWLWSFAARGGRNAEGWLVAALLAAFSASIIEAGKLFVPAAHPDPTDVLIAAGAASLAFLVATWLKRWSLEARFPSALTPPASQSAHGLRRDATSEPHMPAVRADSAPAATVTFGRWCAAAALIAVAVVLALLHPAAVALALALAVYAAVLWRKPAWGLAASLAALPVLDLAPWSGWFFVDELDLLILITLAIALVRRPPAAAVRSLAPGASLLIGSWAISFAISLAVGLWPLAPLDGNAFTSYYSHYNALRVGKGALLALALFHVVIRMTGETQLRQQLTVGMVLGLAGAAAVVLWERLSFSALLDFSTDYRVTGSFSGMHTGGAYIDAYLVMALPFAAYWFVRHDKSWARLVALSILSLGAYAVFVTFSRGAYLAFALGASIMLLGTWRHGAGHAKIARAAIFGAGLLAAIAAVSVLQGPFMQARLAHTTEDFALRLRHWQDAVGMMNSDWKTRVFGMGIGTYPVTHFWTSTPGARSATYSYASKDGNRYLRLGGGEPLYFEQIVPVTAQQDYILSFDLRSEDASAEIAVSVCEKSLLSSRHCRWLKAEARAGGWQRSELGFNSDEVGSASNFATRPVKLSLMNSQPGTVVDVDNIRLLDRTGRNLIANGDFSNGNDRWFFSTENHLAWHIKNLMVHIVFEQGWFGLLAFVIVCGFAVVRLAVSAWRGDLFATTRLAALGGFFAVGLFDSLLDFPRLSLLFFLFVFTALLRPERPPDGRSDRSPAG